MSKGFMVAFKDLKNNLIIRQVRMTNDREAEAVLQDLLENQKGGLIDKAKERTNERLQHAEQNLHQF